MTADTLQMSPEIDAGHDIPNVAARLVVEMANRLDVMHGGREMKTAIILAQDLFRRGFQQISEKGVSFAGLAAGIREALAQAIEAVKALSRPMTVPEIRQARLPASRFIAEAMALAVALEEGLDARLARHTRNHHALKAGLAALGISYAVADQLEQRASEVPSIIRAGFGGNG